MSPDLLTAIRDLIELIMRDENHSGGLLSRETLRLAAVLYQLVMPPQ